MFKISVYTIFLLFFAIPTALPAAPARFESEQVENNPTLKLEVKTRVSGSPRQVYFLLDNLPLTCTVIRILELENFHAQEMNTNLYRARDGAGLAGHLYYQDLSDSSFHATGEGTYTSARLPLRLRGKTSARISWRAISPSKTGVSARLYIQVSNRLLHFTGRVLAPIIRRVARAKTRNLQNVAQQFFVEAENSRQKIEESLYRRNEEEAKTWIKFYNL